MAVLVIQFVITMMMATKAEHGGAPPLPVQVAAVFPRGLVRYLHPSDEELRVYVPTSQLDKKDKKKQRQQQEKSGANGANQSNGNFSAPRNIDIQLLWTWGNSSSTSGCYSSAATPSSHRC